MTDRRNLTAEIHAFLSAHGPATASGIAMAVRARRAAVDKALAGDGFSQAPRPEWGNPRALYFDLSERVLSSGRTSQCSRLLAALSDGRPHTTAELHARAGVMRLNSRIAELRSRGYRIICEHIPGVPAGPHAQAYRLPVDEDVAA